MKINRRALYLLLAVGVMLLIHFLPLPTPLSFGTEFIVLTAPAKDLLAIFAFAIIAWMTKALPLAVTSLATLLLIPAFHITTFSETVAASFGDPLLLFFVGVMLISSAFVFSGFGNRISRWLLSLVSGHPGQIIFVFLLFGALSAMWITEVAAAALLTPVALEILRSLDLKPGQSNFGKSLMLACAWGPLLGGMGTPVGSGSNVLALSLLKKYAGIEISFGQWMAIGLPAIIILLPIAWLLITRAFPSEQKEIKVSGTKPKGKQPLSRPELVTAFTFLTVVVLWLVAPYLKRVTGGAVDLSMAEVALLGGILLFLPGLAVFDWKTAEHQVDWSSIILITAGLALGKVAFDTGAARWLSWTIAHAFRVGNLPPLVLSIFAVFLVGVVHICFSSNTVTGVVMVPLMIAMAATLNVSPYLLAVPAAFSACTAFILVTETPTSIIPYSTGYFSIGEMAFLGIPMTIVVSLVLGPVVYLVTKLMGV